MKTTIGDLRKQIEGLDDELELSIIVSNHMNQYLTEIVSGENLYFRLAKMTADSKPICFVIDCDIRSRIINET